MSTRHTPGPWKAIRNSHFWEIISDRDGQIGDTCASKFIYYNGRQLLSEEAEPIAEANARLMAAAPELLASLKCFLSNERFFVIVGNPRVVERMLADANAAIAKAEGGDA